MIRAATPGEPGDLMTKDLARRLVEQEKQMRKRLRTMHTRAAETARRAVANGYDPNRPNRFMSDSLGDPVTCTDNHNHPCDIGEGQ